MDRRRAMYLLLAATCWGLGTVISKRAVAEIPAVTLLATQLALSIAFLVLAIRASGGSARAAWRVGRIGALGALNPGLAYALGLIGLREISASVYVLAWALEPLAILVLAVLVLRERTGFGLVVGSIVAIGGLVLVVDDPAARGAVPGVLLTLAGVGCCAVYTIASRRWLPGVAGTMAIVLAQEVVALFLAVGLVVATAIAGDPALPSGLTAVGVVSTIVSGVAYYGLAYWFYLTALRSLPASIAATSFYLIPVIGLAGAAATGERLAPIQWLGAALVVAAVVVATRRPAPAEVPAAAA